MRQKLTQIVIDRARCKGDGYTMWDEQQKGLGLRVLKYRKTWTLMQGRDRRRITLGHYPEMGLSEARTRAYEMRRSRNSGIGFDKAVSEFLDACRANNRPQTVYARERVLGRIFASFQGRNVVTISHREVMEAIANETPTVARASFGIIRTLFNYCVEQGYLDASPLSGKKGPRPTASRERVLTDDELRTVVAAAYAGAWKSDFQRLVVMLAFTGQRRGQFADWQVEWADFAAATITFPAEVMKGKRDHTVPYPNCIESLFYYPIQIKGFARLKALFDKETGVKGYTLHDLRRTWRTNVGRLKLRHDMAERIMDHREGGVQAVYNRWEYIEEMREVTEVHAAFLTKLCGLPT